MHAMYSSTLLFVFLALMATTNFCMPTSETLAFDDDQRDQSFDFHTPQNKVIGRFLAQEARFLRTCNKYPRVCVAKGSAGPDCCKKKCVDVMNDRFNCGKCGRKCKYWQLCCQGWCVNPSVDERHCGKCNHKCKKGNSCHYGMCSYA